MFSAERKTSRRSNRYRREDTKKFFGRSILPADLTMYRLTSCAKRSQHPPPPPGTRMKRCPVPVHLALIIVALFADDVKSTVQIFAAGGERAVVAVQPDNSALPSSIRLADSEGSSLEGGRGGRPSRDSVAKPFADVQAHFNFLPSAAVSCCWRAPGTLATLVAQHIRLQI